MFASLTVDVQRVGCRAGSDFISSFAGVNSGTFASLDSVNMETARRDVRHQQAIFRPSEFQINVGIGVGQAL